VGKATTSPCVQTPLKVMDGGLKTMLAAFGVMVREVPGRTRVFKLKVIV
jgi:hypothetical protein